MNLKGNNRSLELHVIVFLSSSNHIFVMLMPDLLVLAILRGGRGLCTRERRRCTEGSKEMGEFICTCVPAIRLHKDTPVLETSALGTDTYVLILQ